MWRPALRTALIFIGIIHILGIFHINVTPLIASAGVVGLAIGFGAQTIVHDVINGIFMLVEHQFDIGDLIKAGGFTGIVEQMSLRTVVLRDGEEVHGVIEWYDRSCLKLNRLDGPNLMIYKPSIKYMYKEGEAR